MKPDNGDSRETVREEITLDAIVKNLPDVMKFLEDRMDSLGCPMKLKMQISVAVEEVFANIASYAYAPKRGNVTISVERVAHPKEVVITFVDQGRPYNPLLKKDPDITLSAEEREIGGLGIFLVKKYMDEVSYEYKDGCNVLTIKKAL